MTAQAIPAADRRRTLLLPGGGHFIGDFNEDFKPHGNGMQYRADGSKAASGQWRNGELHGRGEQIHPDGSRYEGEFTNGWHNGVGRRTWANGDVHEGEWAADEASGFGIKWRWDGSLVQCGRWAENEMVQECPVPRSKVPVGSFLSAAGQ